MVIQSSMHFAVSQLDEVLLSWFHSCLSDQSYQLDCMYCCSLHPPPSVLKAELSSLGGVKALPYLVMFCTSNIGGWGGDYLILKKRYTVAAGRKTINSAGEIQGSNPVCADFLMIHAYLSHGCSCNCILEWS